MHNENEEIEKMPAKKKTKKRSSKHLIFKVLVAVIVLIVGVTYFVYNSSPLNSFSRMLTTVIPYPAVSVGGTMLSIKDYVSEYDSLVSYFKKTGEEGSAEIPKESESRDMILETVTNKIAITKLAKKFKVDLDKERVESFYQDLLDGEESEEAFEKDIAETFGWTVKEFKKRIVESIVLAMQMGEYIQGSEEIQQAKKDFAILSHGRILAGEDFGAVAKEVHAKLFVEMDPDLGFLKLSELPESWGSIVSDLQVGDVSEVIELSEGYAMFTALDRIVAGEETQIHLLSLTVPKVDLEQFVGSYLETIKIKRYLK